MGISEKNRYFQELGAILIACVLLAEFICDAVNISVAVSLIDGAVSVVICVFHTG